MIDVKKVKKILKLLEEYSELNSKCKKIPIESIKQLPKELTHIPAIIHSNKLMMGPNAFKWIGQTVNSQLQPGPTINPKGGFNDFGFSWVGQNDSEFNPNYATYGKETINNGSAINPNDFDSRSGMPIDQSNKSTSTTYQPMNISPVERQIPPQLIPQKIQTEKKIQDTEYSNFEKNRSMDLPLRKN